MRVQQPHFGENPQAVWQTCPTFIAKRVVSFVRGKHQGGGGKIPSPHKLEGNRPKIAAYRANLALKPLDRGP